MDQPHPGPIEELFEKADLSTTDTKGLTARARRAVCACGDVDGAAYYAHRHNRTEVNDTPIMVEFDASIEHVAVDGRDFLYTIFQMGGPELARGILERCFGRPVMRYAELAWQTDIQDRRVALCDLATHDLGVVEAHHANQTVLRGRNRTTFKSAFTVSLPVEAASILRVWSPLDYSGPIPAEVHFDQLLLARSNESKVL